MEQNRTILIASPIAMSLPVGQLEYWTAGTLVVPPPPPPSGGFGRAGSLQFPVPGLIIESGNHNLEPATWNRSLVSQWRTQDRPATWNLEPETWIQNMYIANGKYYGITTSNYTLTP